MTITVNITQTHIDKAIMGQCRNCPIYHAVHEMFPKLDVSVGRSSIHISRWEDTVFRHHSLPKAAIEFIGAFDTGRPVKPTSFPLDIPDEFKPDLVEPDNILDF